MPPPPVVIMMVGLQGSGKTTTSAKIAARLEKRDRKKVLMASLDTRRPAAQEQLRQLGEQTGVATLPIIAGQSPTDIAARAMCRRPSSAAMTWSFSTPPAVRTSTSR
jgi:signal recognition particle subunit SRP54